MEPTLSTDRSRANAPDQHSTGRLAWYVRRLAAMSPAEIAFRLLDSARHVQDRQRRWQFDPPAKIGCPVFPGLADYVAEHPRLDEWRSACERARSGQFAWFGVAWPTADPPDWHLDPVTGRRWPASTFGPSIRYRHDERYGDVKYVWELNRLQYLQPIAALAHVTGDFRAAALVRGHIADWITYNPPFLGINWSSGIELGLRIVSLTIAAALVDPGDVLSAALAESLAAHGWWLARYPSRFSSANNHAIAEALGLFMLGTTMPGLPGASTWADRGRRILERESLSQIHPDGAGCEQAIGYQRLTLEMLSLAARLGARTTGRFEQAGKFLSAITDAEGNTPRIGDDDESRVSLLPAEPLLRSPAPVADGLAHFPDGGYTVVREGPMLLVFDHGPLGYLSIAAHGHADALAIWLHVDGEPVLIDAGTYGYHGVGKIRDALRGTAAHNTLTVAGADQSVPAGPFNWSHKARCKVTDLTESPWAIEAEHDGYRRRFGCLHRRRIETNGPGCFTISDRLIGTNGPWPVSIGFLIAPGLEISRDGDVWRIGKAVRLDYRGPLEAEVTKAEHSPGMGLIETTSRLVFKGLMGASDSSRFAFSLVG